MGNPFRKPSNDIRRGIENSSHTLANAIHHMVNEGPNIAQTFGKDAAVELSRTIDNFNQQFGESRAMLNMIYEQNAGLSRDTINNLNDILINTNQILDNINEGSVVNFTEELVGHMHGLTLCLNKAIDEPLSKVINELENWRYLAGVAVVCIVIEAIATISDRFHLGYISVVIVGCGLYGMLLLYLLNMRNELTLNRIDVVHNITAYHEHIISPSILQEQITFIRNRVEELEDIQTQLPSLTDLPTQTSIPIGTIVPFAGINISDGWLTCEGQAVSRTEFPNLFGVIEEIYGPGDGINTFNLPDCRGRTVIGAGIGIGQGLSDRILGDIDGEETHLIDMQEIPPHDHGLVHYTAPNLSMGGGSHTIYDARNPNHNDWGNTHTKITGGGLPHNNMQPFIVLNYIIKAV